jgi:phosphoribosylamine--glycine ligase
LADARTAAYRLVASIDLPGGQFRSDIGLAALEGRINVG